jgi:hypothetical protein
MVQLQVGNTVDAVVVAPLLAGTVGAGDRQPVQNGEEDRVLDRKREATFSQQLLQHRAAVGVAPQPLEQQRCADALAAEPGDWFSRRVLAWRLSITMEVEFCLEAVEEALAKYGCPEIFNSDQGSQFTSDAFTGLLLNNGISISMDGRGAWRGAAVRAACPGSEGSPVGLWTTQGR